LSPAALAPEKKNLGMHNQLAAKRHFYNFKGGGRVNNKRIIATMMSASFLVAGCASSPDKIVAQSVSTLPYEQHNCKQIGAEVDRVTRRVSDLHGSLDKKASNDSAQMAVGMILFWPALLFLEGGDGPEAAEYSRLKGERDALEKIAIQKECGIAFQTIAEKPKQEALPN
jgi:hypothetical protein